VRCGHVIGKKADFRRSHFIVVVGLKSRRCPAGAPQSVLSEIQRKVRFIIPINRRRFVVSAVIGAASCFAGMSFLSRGVAKSVDAASIVELPNDYGYKGGPAPPLPKLPKTPCPYAAKYLLADGRIVAAHGMCLALELDFLVRQGFARRVPYGLNLSTDKEKLWFFGRPTYRPKRSREIAKQHAKDKWG